MDSVVQSFKRTLFLQKGDYQTCHVLLHDTQEHLAAIIVSQQIYSFFKTIQDRDKALDMVGKLYDSGSDAIITQSSKAYAIWVLEPDALPLGSKHQANVSEPQFAIAV